MAGMRIRTAAGYVMAVGDGLGVGAGDGLGVSVGDGLGVDVGSTSAARAKLAGCLGGEACSTGLPFTGRSHRSTPSAVIAAVRKRANPTRIVVSGSVPSTLMYACPPCILLPVGFILSAPLA